MIPEQLDLFGGPPRPPKRIREEEPDTSSATPEQEPMPETDDSLMATTPIPEPEAMPMEPVPVDMPEAEQVEEPMPDWIVEEEAAPIAADTWEEMVDEEPPADVAETTLIEEEAPIAEPEVAAPVSDVIAWMAPEPNRHVVPTDEAVDEKPGTTLIEPVSDIVVEFPSGKKATMVAANAEVGTPAQMNVPPDEELFKRQYYSMKETAAMFDISHSMLRYWENEFDVLQPRKNRKGDRYFRPVDVKHLQLIYHLLKVRRFTIEGAREYLRNHNKALDTFELIKKLEKLKSFLLELKANVS